VVGSGGFGGLSGEGDSDYFGFTEDEWIPDCKTEAEDWISECVQVHERACVWVRGRKANPVALWSRCYRQQAASSYDERGARCYNKLQQIASSTR
jgi:hypothetical protein